MRPCSASLPSARRVVLSLSGRSTARTALRLKARVVQVVDVPEEKGRHVSAVLLRPSDEAQEAIRAFITRMTQRGVSPKA